MRFQIWKYTDPNGCEEFTCAPKYVVDIMHERRLLGEVPELLAEFQAKNWYEAKTYYHKFMGFEPYVPPSVNGEPDPAVFKPLDKEDNDDD